ncbi:MAG: DNA recombination protein RmuC [Acidimicrobiia bacterium]|nr:DNA recombination protein RmuC [Acidimicrobiia bacterium]
MWWCICPMKRRWPLILKPVSKAYEHYINTEDEQKKQTYLKAHVKSLETHLKGLKEKRYDLLGGNASPDFILMFIPVEPALFLAQSENSNFLSTLLFRIIDFDG